MSRQDSRLSVTSRRLVLNLETIFHRDANFSILFFHVAIISSKVVAKKKDEEEAQRFSDYFDFSEPLKKCSSHRLLAQALAPGAAQQQDRDSFFTTPAAVV